jgi:anti-anti-sigma factor
MAFRETHVLRPSFGQAVVELNGEHDLETRETLAALLASLIEENELVVVDLSQAEFIDSSVLHNLLKADRLARARGFRLRIQLGTAAIVEKALELSGLLDCLEVVPDRERALDLAPTRAA